MFNLFTSLTNFSSNKNFIDSYAECFAQQYNASSLALFFCNVTSSNFQPDLPSTLLKYLINSILFCSQHNNHTLEPCTSVTLTFICLSDKSN